MLSQAITGKLELALPERNRRHATSSLDSTSISTSTSTSSPQNLSTKELVEAIYLTLSPAPTLRLRHLMKARHIFVQYLKYCLSATPTSINALHQIQAEHDFLLGRAHSRYGWLSWPKTATANWTPVQPRNPMSELPRTASPATTCSIFPQSINQYPFWPSTLPSLSSSFHSILPISLYMLSVPSSLSASNFPRSAPKSPPSPLTG